MPYTHTKYPDLDLSSIYKYTSLFCGNRLWEVLSAFDNFSTTSISSINIFQPMERGDKVAVGVDLPCSGYSSTQNHQPRISRLNHLFSFPEIWHLNSYLFKTSTPTQGNKENYNNRHWNQTQNTVTHRVTWLMSNTSKVCQAQTKLFPRNQNARQLLNPETFKLQHPQKHNTDNVTSSKS